jgi:hypothetical protein
MFMSTKQDLLHNSKPVIRRITKGRTWSINIPLSHIKKANISESDYLYSYVDTRNRLVFEPVKVEDKEEN